MKKLIPVFLFVLLTSNVAFSKTLQVSELMDSAASMIDQEVKIEGLMMHVCKHGGKRAFFKDLAPEVEKSIKVEAADCPVFDETNMGSTFRVEGVLKELRIDNAYLDEWESELKAHAHEHEHEEEESCGSCSGDSEEEDKVNPVFERIAGMRKQVAESEKGYLPFYWIEGSKWKIID